MNCQSARSRKAIICCFHVGIAWIGLILGGCQGSPTPPTLPKTNRITAHLYSGAQLGNREIDNIEIPQEYVSQILKIVTPVTFFKGGIRPKIHPHVADVYLHHEDDTVTKITVRYTGHNPAAVSVDGVNYFYASADGPSHGTAELSLLLTTIYLETQGDENQDDNWSRGHAT